MRADVENEALGVVNELAKVRRRMSGAEKLRRRR